MLDTHADPLQITLDDLEQSLAQSFADREQRWAKEVYDGLGHLAKAIHQQAQGSRSFAREVGAANPEVQAVPSVARHAEHRREQQSNLVERIYFLRAEVRDLEKAAGEGAETAAALANVRTKAKELVKAIELERHKMNKFALDAVNSNPGAGE